MDKVHTNENGYQERSIAFLDTAPHAINGFPRPATQVSRISSE